MIKLANRCDLAEYLYMNSEQHSRFYKPPSPDEVEANGSIVADTRARIRAERRGSRLFSAAAAFTMGTLLNISEYLTVGSFDARDAVTNFAIPTLINTAMQLGREHTQKNELGHIRQMANGIRSQYEGRIIELEQEVRARDDVASQQILDSTANRERMAEIALTMY